MNSTLHFSKNIVYHSK